MGITGEKIIATFDELPDSEKREVVAAILRCTAKMEFSSLSDDELVYSAEETFLELDRIEARD